jgi:Phage terminase large subunit (GpA)
MPLLTSDDGVILKRTRSELARALLRIDGKPVNLEDYPMFLAIYDGAYKKTLLKTSRQVGKSTTLSNFSVAESIAEPHFKTFFISPSQEQTHKFSTERVGKTIMYSPLVKKHFIGDANSNRVMVRSFRRGSTIYFSYAQDDADRCRGITADRLCLDEVQDINLEAVLPVVKETIANSEYAYEMYCGTPKTMENGIESQWKISTRTEWAMKCEGCGKYSIIVSENQLGKYGPVCTKCQHTLNPRFGVWVDTNKNEGVTTKGFHISRPIMPKSVPICWPEGPLRDKAQEKWDEVLDKMSGPDAYPTSMFRNEVLGVSDSEGVRLISKEDLESMCDGPAISVRPTAENMKDVMRISAGFDWSGGGTEIKSRTVLTIQGQLTDGRIRVLYFKIFPGTAPLEELNEITAVVKNYDTKMTMFMGGDAGEGNMNMDTLRNRFQKPQRILKIRYVGTQNTYVQWNSVGGFYTLHRTPAIDSMMTQLKMGKYQFPSDRKVMELAFMDILNEHVEVTRQGRKRWDHADNKPDDFLHGLVFGRLALQVSTGELNLGSAL